MNPHAPTERRKGFTTMKNAEASTTENAAAVAEQTATVAEQSTPVAPEKAPSKKGATQKKGAPQGPESRQGRQSPDHRPEEGRQSWQESGEARGR